MKIFISFFLFFLIGISFAFPLISSAQGTGIWLGTSCAKTSTTGGPVGPCTICDAMIVVNNVFNWLRNIALTITVGVVIYGAIRLMLAGGSPDRIKKGKDMMKNALIGFVIVLCSWLIVHTLLTILTGNPITNWNTLMC